ncbi:MAG: acetate--CoA ligase [Bacteroidia bacterium]|nr:acetate--CoA ligase [Bacteroidia bacterium]
MSTYKDTYTKSIADPQDFWKEQAGAVSWYREPEEILRSEGDRWEWYRGATLNTAYQCLDRHVERGLGEKTALIYDSPVTGTVTHYSYAALLDKVSRFAGALTSLGVEKGDRVIIYMPMVPQTAVAMLACARIGAVHSVVFGGFAARELAIRIDDARPKLIITANFGIEIDKIVPYHPMVFKAVDEAEHKPQHIISYNRPGLQETPPSYFLDFEELEARSQPVPCTEVASSDPLYVLYTSGTTGKPKGIVRDNGGHAVALHYSMKYVYALNPDDVFWAASDVGWVVGHSYIVYGPLMMGATGILYEGKPVRTPDAGAFWRVIEQHRVNVFFTAPTAIRAIRKEDPEAQLFRRYDVSSLRLLFLAGERCDVATLQWAEELLQRPVIDHWWQTESGWPMLANMAGLELSPVKPGSSARPVCGYDIRILREDGTEAVAGEAGYLAIKLPLPPGCLQTLWQNHTRFVNGYLTRFPGYYFTGDGGYADEEGYFYITGRVDDIINVAGHRLSTAEMEEIVAAHPAVAECAVIGVHDDLKGEVPLAFVILKDGIEADPAVLEQEILQSIRRDIGPVAALKKVLFVKRLPKTRSGKILRNIMRAIMNHTAYTIPGTIEDVQVLSEIAALA